MQLKIKRDIKKKESLVTRLALTAINRMQPSSGLPQIVQRMPLLKPNKEVYPNCLLSMHE